MNFEKDHDLTYAEHQNQLPRNLRLYMYLIKSPSGSLMRYLLYNAWNTENYVQVLSNTVQLCWRSINEHNRSKADQGEMLKCQCMQDSFISFTILIYICQFITWRVEVLMTAHFPFLCESRSTTAPSSSPWSWGSTSSNLM